jgi:hypothetical protein
MECHDSGLVERLEAMNMHVHCLALGRVDLTSPAGNVTSKRAMRLPNLSATFLLSALTAASSGQG